MLRTVWRDVQLTAKRDRALIGPREASERSPRQLWPRAPEATWCERQAPVGIEDRRTHRLALAGSARCFVTCGAQTLRLFARGLTPALQVIE
ncbi:Protein of unknown function [Gryllus bimaculatus]|nr:Protein of unknown function [Gryllus bimaculatus]